MENKTLPGIIKIEFIAARELTLYPKRFLSPGSSTSAIGNFSKMTLIDVASCNITSERTDAGIIYTTTIGAIIPEGDEFPADKQHYLQEKYHAYRLTDVYGNKYLIGTDEKPHPEISFSPANDGQPSGSRTIPVQIVWKSPLPPIELVIL